MGPFTMQALRVMAAGWVAALGWPLCAGAAIRGTVIDAESGRAVVSAVVRLESAPGRRVVCETTTDDNGKFSLETTPTGDYAITAAKAGYVAAGSPVSLRGSAQNIEVPLMKAAVVSGTVFESTGLPASSVHVLAIPAYSSHPLAGARRGVPEIAVDDRGSFRLYDLTPGSYIIAVVHGPQAGSRVTHPVYYPNTPEPARAQVIRLRPGEMRGSIDFVVTRNPGVPVEGKVAGLPRNDGRAAILLFVRDGGDGPVATTLSGTDGSFRFEDVPPGSYDLLAGGPVAGVTGYGPYLGPAASFARSALDVGGPAAGSLELELRSGRTLRGSAVGEDIGQDADACYPGAQISLEPLDPTIERMPLTGRIDAHGGFQFTGLAPIRYRITVSDLRPPCSLREVKIGSETAPGHVVIPNDDAQVTLVLTRQSGAIHGVVFARREPYPRASVVLVPVTHGHPVLPQDARIAVSGPDGSYRFDGIAPGPYRISAVPLSATDYLDPAFWALDTGRCRAITIAAEHDAPLDIHLATVEGDKQ